ncbi:MAG: putative aminopeptidase YsdC [Chlamydiae bacterium]|nr:putative aminopeptidase YsdC [Chlamydiota bacterium]
MKRPEILKILQELVHARGPSGHEDEVRKYCRKKLTKLCDKITEDPAGNLIGFIKGKKSNDPIRLMAHMDELSLIVKRINEDGSLRVNPVGGLLPSDLGQGPVEILGDTKIFTGIISAHCIHVTEETKGRWRSVPHGEGKMPRWDEMTIFTGKTVKELEKAGVHSGTRVVVSQSRRQIEEVGSYLGGYFFDNRAAIAIGLCTLSLMKKKPHQDIYFVLTTEEEIGCHGASFASRTLPGHTTIAIDVGPAEEEYAIDLNENPIVVYQDSFGVYTKSLTDDLLKAGKKARLKPQCATWGNYGSDASAAKRYGQTAKSGLICIPTRNTHGFEIIHKDGIMNVAKLLHTYLSMLN